VIDPTMTNAIDALCNQERRIRELESILAQRSTLQSEAMRMGQRQGRVELAQELVTISEEVDALPLWVKEHLRNILEDNSNE